MHSQTPHRELRRPQGPTTLLSWLLEVLQPMNRTRVKQLLRSGRVSVNSIATTRHDHPITALDTIAISAERQNVEPHRLDHAGKLPIVHLDQATIVVDKPAGLLSVATDQQKTETAFALLLGHCESNKLGRPYVVHRLDRETSGLLLFARSPAIRDTLQSHWDEVSKTYLAIVEGGPRDPIGTVDNYLTEDRSLRVRAIQQPRDGSRRAITHYRLIGKRAAFALLEVSLVTGRKHQIRVHLAGLGCPVIGDASYGAKSNPAGRLGLHAWKLAFTHPETGERVELQSALPKKLRGIAGEPADFYG